MDRHSRLGGNGLITPLDSGLRRNDEVARIEMTVLPVCVYGPIVIPAKAGIQEGGAGMVNQLQPQRAFPLTRE